MGRKKFLTFFLIFFSTSIIAQDLHLGAGVNIFTDDKINPANEVGNLSFGLIYSRENSGLFYELNFNHLSKKNYSIPFLIRFNNKPNFSLNPGIGLSFFKIDTSFDIAPGVSLGLSYPYKKIKFHLTGSFFQGIFKHDLIEHHPGGTTISHEQNRMFCINFIVYYNIYSFRE